MYFLDYWYGPRHHSRTDLSSVTLLQARDHNAPDYATARHILELKNITTFEDINAELADDNPEVMKT